MWYLKGYFLPLHKTLYFFFLAENKQFTEFKFTIGNDLETSEVPVSVLFCIVEKNALLWRKDIDSFILRQEIDQLIPV